MLMCLRLFVAHLGCLVEHSLFHIQQSVANPHNYDSKSRNNKKKLSTQLHGWNTKIKCVSELLWPISKDKLKNWGKYRLLFHRQKVITWIKSYWKLRRDNHNWIEKWTKDRNNLFTGKEIQMAIALTNSATLHS